MATDLHKVSIRAASWIGAQCVRTFCETHGIVDKRIDAFVFYAEAATSAQDIPRWASFGTKLEVSGLGDALPVDLSKIPRLSELVDSVREITASQMYGAWEPKVVAKFLKKSTKIAGLEGVATRWSSVADHDAEKDGWGKPIFVSEWLINLDKYGSNFLVDELVFHLEHGAFVASIQKVRDHERVGVLFFFLDDSDSFLAVPSDQLEMHWKESKEITSRFTQLSDLVYSE